MARTLTAASLNYLSLPGAPSPAGVRAFVTAELFEFTVGGTTYYLTNFDRNLVGVSPAIATTYVVSDAVLPKVRLRQSAGFEIDDLELEIGHGGSATLGSKTWIQRALDGDLDGAGLKLFRAYINSSDFTVAGCGYLFSGEISDLEPGSTSLRLLASIPGKRFMDRFPVITTSPHCTWDLGSAGCGWAGTMNHLVTPIAASTNKLVKIAALPTGTSAGPHLFFQGAIYAGGYRRAIGETATVSGGYTFTATPPFPAGVIEGLIGSSNSVTLRRGCNKTAGVCDSWYSNLANFLGAPMAPSVKDVLK